MKIMEMDFLLLTFNQIVGSIFVIVYLKQNIQWI